MKVRMRNKKRGAVLLLAAALCLLLAGCAGKEDMGRSEPVLESSTESKQVQVSSSEQEGAEESQTSSSEQEVSEESQTSEVPADETPAPDKNAAAKETYLDFLNGKGVVTTNETYRQVEGEYNGKSPAYGTYSYQELKYAIAEAMGRDSTACYTFLDIGGDGTEELVLRFENEDPSFFNWTGFIRCDDGKLTLVYSFEDGYRTIGDLFTSGCVMTGGSGGAGFYVETYIFLAEDGAVASSSEFAKYQGNYALSIFYQLFEDDQKMPQGDQYDDLSYDFCVSTCLDGNGLAFSVEYSNDAESEARALEADLVRELTEAGAQLVDSDEIERRLDETKKYCTQRVAWTDFEDGLLPYYNAEVTARHPEEWWYRSYPEYEEVVLDSTEYAVSVAVETTKPVTDFQVVSLEIVDYTEQGPVCSTTELFSLPELTPEKPILITLAFPGDLPSSGVKFVDTFGNERLFTFSQSGMDGSLIFEEAELTHKE